MEQLIEELVDPKLSSSPVRVKHIQKEIQSLQRQPTGWQLGLELLKNPSGQFRFYGALTLTVKIRNDSDFLEAESDFRTTILKTLVESYVDFTNQSEQPYVLRKLCSTLAAFSLRPKYAWLFPLRHVLTSLWHGHLVEPEDLADFQNAWAGLPDLTAPQLRSALWLSSSIVEEATKHDVYGVTSAEVARCVAVNALDSWHLIYLTLQGLLLHHGVMDPAAPLLPDYLTSVSEGDLLELSEIALDAASTWISFQTSYDSDDSSINVAKDAAMTLIFRCFRVPEIAGNTISCLTTIAEQAPKCLTSGDSELLDSLLSSEQAVTYIAMLLHGNFDFHATLFVAFLLSLLELHDLSSPKTFDQRTARALLGLLQKLMYTPGTAVVVDEACQTVLDAFNQIADGWNDWVGSSAADQLLKPLLDEACLHFAVKIQYPAQDSEHPIDSWEPEERVRFQEFRHDVQDLLLASYACIGPELIEHLTAPLQSRNVSPGCEDFEAQLFCIATFADIIASDRIELGRHISSVFGSSKWNFLISDVLHSPEKARLGAINFISRNTENLEHHTQYLFSCINFLFTCLQIPGSAASASRAICVLCHQQRSVLVNVLPQFIASVSGLSDVNWEERHRLFGAVAAIIQAMSSEESKMAPLVEIFTLIDQSSGAARWPLYGTELSSPGDLLQALAAVGKGLRAPPETPIDVDSQPGLEHRSFWTEGGGRHVQESLQRTLDHVVARYLNDAPLVENTCEILRSGYTERHPSPFKLAAPYNAALLTQMIRLDSPSIGLIIDTASAFLASQPSSSDAISPEASQIASTITHSQWSLLESFAATKTYDDHEFTCSSLNFFTRMLPRCGGYFADSNLSQAWQILFEFSLLNLVNPDTLPRRSAAQFWTVIFDISVSLNHEPARNLEECIQHFCPRFVTLLLQLVGGEAARSELDVLTEPLKRFVNKQGILASKLLRDAAVGMDGGDGNVKRFVEQAIALRGARKTRDVVKQYWIGAKGAAFAYAR